MRLLGISVLFFLVLGCSESVEYEQDPNDQRKFLDCEKRVSANELPEYDHYLIEVDYEGQRVVDGHITSITSWDYFNVGSYRSPRTIYTMPLSESLSTENCLLFETSTSRNYLLDRRNLRIGHDDFTPRSGDCFSHPTYDCELIEFSEYQRRIDQNKKDHQRWLDAYNLYRSESEQKKKNQI